MAKKTLSIHEEHRLLALERHQVAKHAFSQGWNNSVLDDYHMSMELIMKSAIYKHGGKPPTSSVKGHDLVEISKSTICGQRVKKITQGNNF